MSDSNVLKSCLFIITLAWISCQNATQVIEKQKPYNIIFIMADDHAEKAISAYGGGLVETPHIDRIAKEGILFKNSFVTNSICAPSRAVLLTGKYSHLNRLRDNRDEFDGSQLTFPKILQQAGYQTSINLSYRF
jgi:arylsulfatase A-like enzyme